MKKLYTVVLVGIMLLTSTRPTTYVSADGPVGADCTDPPNLVPFADLRNCDLGGRNMEGVDLSNADLSVANLDNASLRNTNLEDGYAPGGSFVNADLRGANLYFAFLLLVTEAGENLYSQL